VRKLRGSSGKVKGLREILNRYTDKPGWSSMWGLLGEKGRREAESLASVLSNFYADDVLLADTITVMIGYAEEAVSEVQATLGPPGRAYAFNIPAAAELLGLYATMFSQPQQLLDELVESLEDARAELSTS